MSKPYTRRTLGLLSIVILILAITALNANSAAPGNRQAPVIDGVPYAISTDAVWYYGYLPMGIKDKTPLPTATAIAITPPAPGNCKDAAVLVGQSPVDGSAFHPGDTFPLKFTFKNNGTCTWTKDYRMLFFSGDKFGSDSISFQGTTQPGGTMDIVQEIFIPTDTTPGKKTTIWVLQNASKVYFYSFWLDITVY